MATNIAGFEYRGTQYGGQSIPPRIVEYLIKDAETIRKGDMLIAVEVSGVHHVDIAAAASTAIIGIALEHKVSAAAGTVLIRVALNTDAIFAVKDDTIRAIGALMKLGTGGSGAMTVVTETTATDAQFEVVSPSSATEWTIFRVLPRASLLNSA